MKGDENVVADALTRKLVITDDDALALPCETWPLNTVGPPDGGVPPARKPAPRGTATPPGEMPLGIGCDAGGAPMPGRSIGRPPAPASWPPQDGGPADGPGPPGCPPRTATILAITANAGGWTRRRSNASHSGTGDRSYAGERASNETGAFISATPVSPVVLKNAGGSNITSHKAVRFMHSVELSPTVPKGRKRCLKTLRGGGVHSKGGAQPGAQAPLQAPPEAINPYTGNPGPVGFTSIPPRQEGVPLSDPGQTRHLRSGLYNADGTDNSVNRVGLDSPAGGTDNSMNQGELNRAERLFDDLFDRIRESVASDPTTQTEEKRKLLRVTERDNLLWRDHRLYIPDDTALKYDILYWHHDVPWCAHLGIEKTMALVERGFYWPGMSGDIREYIRTCHKCQANKTDRRVARPPLTPLPSPEMNWKVLGVDLIVDLPPTVGDNYNAICVFVCHLSKMC